MKKNIWTIPKVKSYPIPGKDWYVWFRFNGGNPKRFSDGINQHETFEKRMKAANVLRDSLEAMLKAGWIPESKQKAFKPKKLKFIDAISFSMEKLKLRLSPKSYLDYSGTCRFVFAAAKKLKFHTLYIDQVERYHVKIIFEQIKSDRSWSNHAYNKNLGYFKSILSELMEYELIKNNPAHGIKSLKYDTPPTEFPTDVEQTKIICKLSEYSMNYLIYIKTLYQTGMRPVELLRLKVSDIDLARSIILLRSTDGKTNKYRMVPIKPDLKPDLEKLLLNAKPDWYVFGTYRHNGGKHHKHKVFCPNPTQIKRETPTRIWKTLIKDELGIDKKMYSLKHKAANDMLFDGVDLETIQTVFGHSKSKTTEIYANQINKIRFEKAKARQRKFK